MNILRRQKFGAAKAALMALEERFQMKNIASAALRNHRSPVVTKRPTVALGTKVVFRVESKATKPQISDAVEKAVRRSR